jgi:hypothetical protein
MEEILLMAVTAGVSLFGYVKSRKFVRERLRFVDAAHKPVVPVATGAIAAFAAWPVAAFLPIIGLPTALIFGLGVGWGVHHGSRDAQKRLPPA